MLYPNLPESLTEPGMKTSPAITSAGVWYSYSVRPFHHSFEGFFRSLVFCDLCPDQSRDNALHHKHCVVVEGEALWEACKTKFYL